MNELIKVNYYSNRQTASARELHEFLEVETQYTIWIERMVGYGFSENIDYRLVSQKRLTNNPKNPETTFTDHEITLEMAKEIAMIQRTDKGKQARLYFLELEKQWNSPEAVMARAIKIADRTILKLKSKIEEDKPKVLFADSVTASSTSILVGDLAKLLKQNGTDIGEIRLWKWMREKGYAIKEEGRSYNMPTQKSMELKVMEIKEGTRINSEGVSKIIKTTTVTGKGQLYFINKFLTKTA